MRGKTRGDALRRLGFRLGCIRSLLQEGDETRALIKLNGQWIDYADLDALDRPAPEGPPRPETVQGGFLPLYRSARSRPTTVVEWYEAEENSA